MITKFLNRSDGRIVIEIKAKESSAYPCFDYNAWKFIETLTNDDSVQPGDVVAVATKSNNYHKTSIILTSDPERVSMGFGGNMNPEICKFHGWRGTTCDVSFNAYGVRKVESVISRSMANGRWKLRIVLGRDLVRDKE